ncbi:MULTISPECIES: glycoside hydrolase family 6 protein [Catenuloplanes]|uniref:Glucanase n=1 Tax=Catenuloplanes niger TaxID=587534 RepID=A0AAE4CWS9_9ACTN|nr:glycoside hydrolase family 6 protein [Catenuloplanes niger]MDR7325873.1 endoglucanase [Catenuloplanes niger]
MHIRGWQVTGAMTAAVLAAGVALAVTANAGDATGGTPNASLTLGKPATSKQRSCKTAESPAKAVDGSVAGTSTKWCSADGATKTLDIDLGTGVPLAKVVVRHAGAGGEAARMNTRAFTIGLSTDGRAWTTAATVTGNTASVTEHAVSATARWIRLSTTDPIARIYEVEAHGSASAAPSPSPSASSVPPSPSVPSSAPASPPAPPSSQPAPPPATGGPLAKTSGFFVDPNSEPAKWALANRNDPRAARITAEIASRPIAKWFGEWFTDIGASVDKYVDAASAAGKLPVLVAYTLPGRDACSGHSGGGQKTPAEYKKWISAFAAAIGDRPAVVIVEPDALGDAECMTAEQIAVRNELLNFATGELSAKAPQVWAYLDAGNVGWGEPTEMAARLHDAGVRNVRGFALNVSNFHPTDKTVQHAEKINAQLRLKGYTAGFVIDTSRNGNGHAGSWCNPPRRKLGSAPQAGTTGEDYRLWVKTPGISDGPCGTAPGVPSGTYSPDLAIGLIDGS